MRAKRLSVVVGLLLLGAGWQGCSSAPSSRLTAARDETEALTATESSAPGKYVIRDATSGLSVDAELRGVTPAPAERQQDGSVVFRSAYHGADLVERKSPDHVEDFLLFQERPAQEQTEYGIALGPTVAGLRLVENVLEFLDASGVPRIRISPPFVTGADDVTSTGTLAIEGCAVDTDPTPPWTRPPVDPGSRSCTMRVSWAGLPVVYPAMVDPSWNRTGLMVHERFHHVALPLPGGRVLVAGGEIAYRFGGRVILLGSTNSAEIYDPVLRKWTPTGNMQGPRTQAAGARLADGRVLVAGGGVKVHTLPAIPMSGAELYDPATGRWRQAGQLATERYDHAAVAQGGEILFCGGQGRAGALASCERFGTSFAAAPAMTAARAGLSLVASGANVLAIGGRGEAGALRSAEVLVDGRWSAAAQPAAARAAAAAVALPDGDVLVAGGAADAGAPPAERYSFATGTWTSVAAPLPADAAEAAAAVSNGVVLIAGGRAAAALGSSALLDAAGGRWAQGPAMLEARAAHSATALPDGTVLVAGGLGADGAPLRSSELLQVPRGTGAGCGASSECVTGTCADGVCCNTACTDVCGACDLPGSEGFCTPTAAPRHGSCGGEGVCAGSCAGELGCAYPGAAAVCVEASCSGGQATAAATCDGAGRCLPAAVTSCDAYACGPTACNTACASGADCAGPGTFCAAGGRCLHDTVAPDLRVAAVSVQATGPDGAAVPFEASAVDAMIGPVPVSCAPPSGSRFALGATPVTCSAVDLAGNAATATFTVEVVDTLPPALSLPAPILVDAAGWSGTAVDYAATATDAVDGAVAVTCDLPPGWLFPSGTTTVQCTARDARGNAAFDAFTVTVADLSAPALTLPDPITAEAQGGFGAVVAFAATAEDRVDGATPVACTPAPSSAFPLGTTRVTCATQDTAGNVAEGAFDVVVRDTTPPALTLPAPLTVEATSAAGAMPVFPASAADAVDGPVAVTCTRGAEVLRSTEAGFGSLLPYPVDETVTVTCSATDARSNTVTGQVSVSVVDTMPPAIQVPTEVVAEATSPAGAPVSYAASADDVVDGAVTPGCAPAAGTTFAIGQTSVSCSARDAHGNASTRTFTVTVRASAAPVLAVPADVTAEATSAAGAAVEFTATASDPALGAVAVECSPTSGSVFPLGQTLVSCSATNGVGVTSGTFLVTVVDTTPPQLTLPGPLSALSTSPSGATVSWTATAFDQVDPVVAPVCSPASGSLFPVGQTAVTCSASDSHGNPRTGSFTVTVTSAKPYALHVQVLYAPGRITGPGIDCYNNTGTCAAQELGPVTLTAIPPSGFNVKAWTGCTPSADLATCTVPGTGNQAVAVEFQPGPPAGVVYTLQVQVVTTSGNVSGGGLDCTNNSGTCKVDMTGPITLRATPTSGFSVKAWTGCTPSDDLSTCAVTPDRSKVVAIEFTQGPPPPRPRVLNVHMVTFSGAVRGGGIDCTNNTGICQVTMAGETTLTAFPSPGFAVKAWTGCTPSADLATCVVPGTVDQAVAIEFVAGPVAGTQFTLGVRMLSGSGTVTGGGLDCTDNAGTCSVKMSGPVTLRATPASGFRVKSWGGCTPSADLSTCSVPGTADAATSVSFEAVSGTAATLSVQVLGAAGAVTGGGIDCGGAGTGCSAPLTGPVTLVASPAAGNTVQGWTGCTPSADLSSCSVSGTASAAVTVTFQSGTSTTRALSVVIESASGTITGGGISCKNNQGTCAVRIAGPVALTAQPAPGYVVTNWSGCSPSPDLLSCTVDGTRDAVVYVGFGMIDWE